MSVKIDPVFETETMVQILRDQGSRNKAMDVAEKILVREPQNESVARILSEMKEEQRLAWEKFQKGGRAQEAS